ncbi:MAG: GNAT family N-acetyltransferase [Armatimonadota bacterium]|nr:GNAT family N-acetyltransferase [Armatimonadota bacterium]
MDIRQANETDLPTFVEVFSKLWPNHLGLAELRRDLELMPEKQRMTMFMAEIDGEPVGVSRFYRLLGAYHPQKWFGELGILPDHRGNGLGTQLYDHAIAFLKEQDAIQVTGRANDDDEKALQFLKNRGFVETKRDFESVLKLSEINPDVLVSMDNPNFDIRTAQQADSERFRHQWHQLFETVRKDIPRDEPPTPFTFEEFGEIFFNDKEFLWDVSMFAFEGEELIGLTYVYEMDNRGVLFQGLTAAHRDYRGRGLAKALKTRAMRRALEKGFLEVHADNDTRNTAMIAINNRLGYQNKPGMISLRKLFA